MEIVNYTDPIMKKITVTSVFDATPEAVWGKLLDLEMLMKICKPRARNRIVTVWNHLITLRRTDDNKTLYTDEVELYAGIFTHPAAFWSKTFYRHRQIKWQQIL